MRWRRARWMALYAAASAGVALSAEAPVTVAVPADFGVRPRGTSESVVYSEVIGETTNPIDKRAIEAQCDIARRLGLTDKHPVFEPGHDQPLKTHSRRFFNPRRSASYDTLEAYECDRDAPAATSTQAVCDCIYRPRARRQVEIRHAGGGHMETVGIDLAQRKAVRSVTAGRPTADPDAIAARFRTLAPEVVGRDEVAGIPCVLRRQRLSADAWIDRCISEDERHVLPQALRHRTLSETLYSQGGREVRGGSKAVTVIPHASVDASQRAASVARQPPSSSCWRWRSCRCSSCCRSSANTST